jgi:hypothetical protein
MHRWSVHPLGHPSGQGWQPYQGRGWDLHGYRAVPCSLSTDTRHDPRKHLDSVAGDEPSTRKARAVTASTSATGELEGQSAFMCLLGLHLEQARGDRVAGWFEVGAQHHQPWGLVHGGVFTAVIETVATAPQCRPGIRCR